VSVKVYIFVLPPNMAIIAKDWWYIFFALFNMIGLVVGVIYEIFISSTECRSLSTWLIFHSVICLVYYIFMRYFYKAFQNESKHLEMEYVALNQHVKLLMDSLGYGTEICNVIEDPTQGLLVERDSNASTKIYSHELGALTFLCVYVASLIIGIILFCQNISCEPWLSYGTLALISGCVLSFILHGCLRCNGIYSN
jgi:hypothetical protein